MLMAISDIEKSLRGRPRVDAVPVTVRVPPDLLEALDAWIANSGEMSRPEAIRLLMQDALHYIPKTADNTYAREFGAHIRKKRQELDLKKTDLAKSSGLSIDTINRIERDYPVSEATAKAVLEALEWKSEEYLRKKSNNISPKQIEVFQVKASKKT